MNKEILVTYFNGFYYTYEWLDTEIEVKEWLEEYKHRYSDIEIIKIKEVEVIYEEYEKGD